jgi:hypothetical protein
MILFQEFHIAQTVACQINNHPNLIFLPNPRAKKPWKTLIILMGDTNGKSNNLKREYQITKIESQIISW